MNDRDLFLSTLHAALESLGLECTPPQAEQMWRGFELLRAANAHLNLTRITDPQGAAVRHFADSLALAARLRERAEQPLRLLDVGTGGGFPALPLAILRPAWKVAAIDGTAKKVRAVASFIERLELTNCTAQQARVEEWSATPEFEVMVFRAVAPLDECLRHAGHAASQGCLVVCYKARPLPENERASALAVSAQLGFEHLEDWPYCLTVPGQVLERQLCCYRMQSRRARPLQKTRIWPRIRG